MKNKICIIGSSTIIASEFISLLGEDTTVVSAGRGKSDDIFLDINCNNFDQVESIPLDCDKYLITLGYLLPKKISDQTRHEVLNSMAINLLYPVKLIERIIEKNQKARIVIIGSESGFKGSYDTSYFISKAAISSYVREKRIKFAGQQLVMIAPSVILDTKMTQERKDYNKVLKRVSDLPKKRYLISSEVAKLIYHV